MLNEEKIRIMTRMAMYEADAGKADVRRDAWFKGDYLSKELLLSFLAGTAAFAVLAGVYAFYHIETLMLTLYSMDILALARQIGLRYVLFMLCFEAVTWIVCSLRYERGEERLRRYCKDLRRLSDGYGGKDSDRK